MPTTASNQVTDQIARPSWLTTEVWPFKLRLHKHRNEGGQSIDIHYTDEGSGPTLVFVHAGMWSFIWRDAIKALRSDFRCIAIDFPGTGLSGGTRRDVDIATFPTILDEVLDHCGVDSATFIVHDLGGVVGVRVAGHRPERINGLVAVNSFGWPPESAALRTMLRLMGSRTMTGTLGTMRVIPRMTRTKAGVGAHYDADDRRAFFGPYESRAKSRNFHRAMRSVRPAKDLFHEARRSLMGPLAGLPMLTIFGEKNDQFGFADQWKTLFPHAHQWVVEAGNHFPMCDDPEGFVAQLVDWHRNQVTPNNQPEVATRVPQ